MNDSGINPLGYNVLVRPKEVEAKTKGGLILSDETLEKEQFGRMEGELIALSPMAFTFEGDWPSDVDKPALGARVLFSKYTAVEVRGRDDKFYWMMKDRDLMAVMV